MSAFIPPLPVAPRQSVNFSTSSSFTASSSCKPQLNSRCPRMSLSDSNNETRPTSEPDDKSSLPSTPQVLTLSRRSLLRLLSGSAGLASLYLTYRTREQFRYLSTNGVLNTFFANRMPLCATAATAPSPLLDATSFIAQRDRGPELECPEFPSGSDWINSNRLSLQHDLAGKIVLLDFFTYCCINCMHVLPQLAALESRHGFDGSSGFVVVGVHSAKFPAERETPNIAAAASRLNIAHPVLNDKRMALWRALGVTSWPTLALLGPRGNLLSMWKGEGHADDVENLVTAALQYYTDELDRTPIPSAPSASALAPSGIRSLLRYPGKVTTTADGKLFVADSSNNRVVEIDAAGRIVRSFGDCIPGFVDGSSPRFRSPQGIVVHNGTLYIADTENHAVRAGNLSSGSVTTIGGTGQQGFDYQGGAVGTLQPFSSPWDLEIVNGKLFVAMAGIHQLWTLDLEKRGAAWEVFSGTGREGDKNSNSARSALWAQPSHLSFGGGALYVADSESSSVRAVDLESEFCSTRTIAGGDEVVPDNMFAFGDRDGRGRAARFQHPLAVLFDEQRDLVFVADSYNHSIKTVDRIGVARTFCGSGKRGFADGVGKKAEFWEPSGLAMSSDSKTLYVADTNNSAVRLVDIASKTVSTLDMGKGNLTVD